MTGNEASERYMLRPQPSEGELATLATGRGRFGPLLSTRWASVGTPGTFPRHAAAGSPPITSDVCDVAGLR